MFRTISRTELLAELDDPGAVTLVEAMGAEYFADAHLPGAVNIPPGQVERLTPVVLPDVGAPIVVYCSGNCDSSLIVARHLARLGYLDVRVLDGGKEEWVEHGLPVERADEGNGT